MAQINLADEIARALERLALTHGFSLEQYLAELVRQVLPASASPLSGEELIAAIHAEASDPRVKCEGTHSRADIYSDHD